MYEFMGYTERVDLMHINPVCTAISSSQMPIIQKPSHGLQSRSESQPIHQNAQCDRAGKHLVEWPCRMSGNTQDWQGARKIRQPQVTFSESSTMQLYHIDQLYAHTKSYSKDDCKQFSRDSLMEAVRITNLMDSFTSFGASTEESFKYLLKND